MQVSCHSVSYFCYSALQSGLVPGTSDSRFSVKAMAADTTISEVQLVQWTEWGEMDMGSEGKRINQME